MPKSCISFNEVVNKTHQFDKNLESRILKSMPKKFTKTKKTTELQRVQTTKMGIVTRIGCDPHFAWVIVLSVVGYHNSKVKKLGYLSRV